MIHLRGSRIGGIVQQLLVFPFPFKQECQGSSPRTLSVPKKCVLQLSVVASFWAMTLFEPRVPPGRTKISHAMQCKMTPPPRH
jgi:hypothetical protein